MAPAQQPHNHKQACLQGEFDNSQEDVVSPCQLTQEDEKEEQSISLTLDPRLKILVSLVTDVRSAVAQLPSNTMDRLCITRRRPYLGFRVEAADPGHHLNNATGVRSRHPHAAATPEALIYHLYRQCWALSPFVSLYTTLDAARLRIQYFQDSGCQQITVFIVWLHHHPTIYDAYRAAKYLGIHKKLAVLPGEVLLGGALDRACVLYEWTPETLARSMVSSRALLAESRRKTLNKTRIYRGLVQSHRRRDEARMEALQRDRRLLEYHAQSCNGSDCLKSFQNMIMFLVLGGCSWDLVAGLDATTIVVREVVSVGNDTIVLKVLNLFTCAGREKGKMSVEAKDEAEVKAASEHGSVESNGCEA